MQIDGASRSGVLLIDKPNGITSAKAIATAKKRLQIQKIGHTGTLDPMATGLLVTLVDEATRLARFIDRGNKVYTGKIQFGLTTDSDDITGKTVSTSSDIPSFDEIVKGSKRFIGEISQVPPSVSAVKVDGERSYVLARQGQAQPLSARQVTVAEFLIEADSVDTVSFRVSCSKGTYIRSLARDLGALLGCGGCLKSLRREQNGLFSVTSAKELDRLAPHDIVPLKEIFRQWPSLTLSDEVARQLEVGNQAHIQKEVTTNSELPPGASFVVYSKISDPQGYLGVLECVDGNWKVAVNFKGVAIN